MDIFYSILAGVIQGLTEFLPISSSGHLVIIHRLLPYDLGDEVTFDVILHAGTLLALVFYFWTDIVSLTKSFFKSFIG